MGTVMRAAAILVAVTVGILTASGPALARHNFSMLEDIEPGQVEAGETVSVSGFSYSDTVEIRFGAFDGPVLAELEPNANEDIAGEVEIPADAEPGRYIVYAVQRDDAGNISRFPGQADVWVVGESGPPLDAGEPDVEPRPAGLVTRDDPSLSSLLLVALAVAGGVGVLMVALTFVLPARTAARDKSDAGAASVRASTRVGIVAVALVTVMSAVTAVVADEPTRRTEPVRATHEDDNPSRTYATPVVAVDPNNPMHVVAVAAETRSRRCSLLRSEDGGQTWDHLGWEHLQGSPTLEDYPFCFQTETGPPQAVAAFGSDGTLYYAYDGWATQDAQDSDWPMGRGGGWRGNVSVIVSRSDDLGSTWNPTMVRDARGLEDDEQENNRPVSSLVVDTDSAADDVVYVAWNQETPDRNRPVVARSPDAGASFSDPMDLTGGYFEDEAAREPLADAAGMDEVPPVEAVDFSWPDLTVDDDGTLYAVWAARLERGPQLDGSATYLSRSTDGGETFTVTELSPAPDVFYYPVIEWDEQGGEHGTLHLVYEQEGPQQAQWVQDIFHTRSTDRGETWSEPATLNDDDPAEYNGQFHPNIDIAPNGRIDVAWWDFRHEDGTFANDVYATSSTDNGATWSDNYRVTDRSINRLRGVWYGNADIRQAPGIAATDSHSVIAWDDTRDGTEATQTQDIYTALTQHEPVNTGVAPTLQYALAVAGGLATFGLAFLLSAFGVRRRSVGGARAARGDAPGYTG